MDAIQAPLDNDAARDEIAHLEARIAALTESIERCRKVDLVAKLVLAAGIAWAMLMVIGALPFARLNVVGAIAAVLGGIVLFGSNASTARQTAAALGAAEALRAELIESLDLRAVGPE